MHEQLFFTAFLNRFLGKPVSALLNAIGIHPHDAANPITDPYAMQFLVFVLLLLFFVMVRARLSVDKPGVLQQTAEGVERFIQNQSNEMIGPHSERYTPFLVTLGLFILGANLLGLIPTFIAPTFWPVVPLGCAVCTFVYYNFQGIRQQGLGRYFMHFFGPQDPSMSMIIRLPVSLLLLPIELFSHFARMISLTIRLYANIFAGDMVTLVFFSLIPLGIPVVFLGLHLGVSLIQTYIFVLLASVYLQGAVAEEH